MKSKLVFSVLLLLGIVLLNSCGSSKVQKERDFIISKEVPASALTIGWYAPVNVLEQLVGKNYTPRIVKDGKLSAIMIFIVSSEEHTLDGKLMGPMKAAHLVIPVEKPGNLNVEDQSDIEAAMVCPLNIIDQSNELGDKYADFTFGTYSGEINLKVERTEKKIMAEATVKTVNGLIEINGMFEGEGETKEVVSAMFSSKSQSHAYFYGEEQTTRFVDGKGNLKTEGDNMIKAMNLSGQPYFLRLDTDISWSFDFIQE